MRYLPDADMIARLLQRNGIITPADGFLLSDERVTGFLNGNPPTGQYLRQAAYRAILEQNDQPSPSTIPQGAQGLTGPQGEVGPAGPAGATGATGPKGDKGDPGVGGATWGGITGTLASQTDLNTALGTKAASASLAPVATSGVYADLTSKPTIPSALSALTDDATHRLTTDTEKGTWNGKETGGAVATHATLTTGVHGAGANSLIYSNDSRLADSRTPSAHASTHVTGSSDVIPSAVAAGNAGLMTGTDKTKLDGIASGATVGATWGSNITSQPTLATVATSGAYSDLSGKPTLAATKAAVSGQPLLSYDSGTAAFTQGALTAANVGLGNVTNIAQAPVGATYITQTADATLSAEQALGSLATGIVKNTTTTGVLSIAAASDLPTFNLNAAPIADIDTAAAAAGDILIRNAGNTQWTHTSALPSGTSATTQAAGDNSTKLATTAYVDACTASITGASGAINTTETVIHKTTAMPANSLLVGSVKRFTLLGTCTSSAANVSTFALRFGTLGTTSDGVLATISTSAAATTGTTIGFTAEIWITVRTVGSSATASAFLRLTTTGVTGIAAVATQTIPMTMSAFNTTTANWIMSATYKSAASTTTCTFQEAFCEAPVK